MRILCNLALHTLAVIAMACAAASGDDVAHPLVLEKSGPERQSPERLLPTQRRPFSPLMSWRKLWRRIVPRMVQSRPA